jgi:hypothetical protein
VGASETLDEFYFTDTSLDCPVDRNDESLSVPAIASSKSSTGRHRPSLQADLNMPCFDVGVAGQLFEAGRRERIKRTHPAEWLRNSKWVEP